MSRAKPANIFLSPLKLHKQPNNRIKSVTMRMATAGEVATLTLTYDSKATAQTARTALIAAGNVYAVSTEALWKAIAESIAPSVPEGL